MRLEFNCSHEFAFDHDDEIPILCRPEIAGKSCLLGMKEVSWEPFFFYEIGEELDESVKLLSSCYHRAIAGILVASS